MINNNLFLFTSGPANASILIIGEAWGAEEAYARAPFVGQAGKELDKMLFEAGLLRSHCLLTNLVNAQPANNDFTKFLIPTKEAKGHTPLNGIYPSALLRTEHKKLLDLIQAVRPKLIIGCGNWPLWALRPDLTRISTTAGYKVPGGIMNWRGSQLTVELDNGNLRIPYLPILHPASILRDWSLRAPTVHDLRVRAARYLRGEIAWRTFDVNTISRPDYGTAKVALSKWLSRVTEGPLELSVDLETFQRKYISVIGISDGTVDICFPLFYFDTQGAYQDVYTAEEEESILLGIRHLLRHPNVCIIGQNFAYDTQWLFRFLGVDTPVYFDTMLAHHLLFPGTPKSLDYLASLYIPNYVYWKEESEDWTGGDPELLWNYNCRDTRATFLIAQELKEVLTANDFTEQYSFQLEQWQLAVEMMRNGVRYDVSQRARLRTDLLTARKKLEDYLLSCVPEDTRYTDSGRPWFASPTKIMDIFYRQMELKPVLHKKTKRPTSDAQALETLAKRYPYLRAITRRLDLLRSIDVFNSHFIDAEPSPDGRIHCAYNVAGPETFRWSSSVNAFGEGTNLQNIPKGEV